MVENKQTNECKCIGSKEIKALKKDFAQLLEKVKMLEKQIDILRKALIK